MEFFNHSITRLAITSFMDFFSRFSIEKFASIPISGGNGDSVFVQRKIIPVPIQWAAREKWVEIIRSSSSRKAMDPSIRDKNPVEMMWILPRISCNLNGITYDANRRLVKTQQISDNSSSSNNANTSFSPATYNLELEISTIARQIDDNLQLMEQIIPYFSPAMNMNLELHGNGEIESIPIVLNSISVDIPTDIPEFEERIFTNVYNFTMKLNYYMIKRLKSVITNINANLIMGQQIVEINKEWLLTQNRITERYNEYVLNASRTNPLVISAKDVLTTQAISALGKVPIYAYLNKVNNTLSLYTEGLSGSEYQSLFHIYYRTDTDMTIHKYDSPLTVTFSNIYFWLVYSPIDKSETVQFQVYTFKGGIGQMIVKYNFEVQ